MFWNKMNNAEYVDSNGEICIKADAMTDYFVNPIDNKISANAQFIYTEIEGDFTLRAKVSHNFAYIYDACALFACQDDTHWAKACFEATDFNTKAVVSVMTNGLSDDANGVNIDSEFVYLQLARKNNAFAVHYSLDGKKYYMVRLCNIPMHKTIKVGLLAQSPIGSGGDRFFSEIRLIKDTATDFRNGNFIN